jgi:dUTP pyrophosphatase
MLKLKVKKLTPEAKIPTRGTEKAAGLDLYALNSGRIYPGEREMVQTGVAFEIPDGYFLFARPRSGIATKHGVNISSSCVIDSDYRGEMLVCLINLDKEKAFTYSEGDRIAQVMLLPVPDVEVVEVNELSETNRGTGGFGHTGR